MKTQNRTRLRMLSATLAAVLCASLSGAYSGTVNARLSMIDDGVAIYGQRCAICHSKDGAGLPNWKTKGQPDFTNSDWQNSHNDAQIADVIRNGKGKFMPAFKEKLSEEQIMNLVKRIRAFKKK